MAAISKTPSGSYRGVFTSQPIDSLVDAINNMTGHGTPQSITPSAIVGPAPTAVGATSTVTAAKAGNIFLLGTAAGSVATLPAATGTGNVYKFIVSTTATSNAHKILTAPITDVLVGRATGAIAAGTTLQFSAVTADGFHSIQMPFAGTQPSGGFEGDYFEFTDFASGKWEVVGVYKAGTTATTPFSTATT